MGDTKESTLERVDTTEPDFVNIYYKNDNKTTFEFVIETLVLFFNKSYEEAMTVAAKVDSEGSSCVQKKVLKEIAETKIEQVTSLARKYNYPLEVFYK